MNLYRPTFRRYLLLLLCSAIFAVPLVWMFTCSLKSQAELIEHPYSLLPAQWNWNNYPDAVQSMPYLRYLGNSVFLCTLNVIGSLFSCSLVAYGFARLRFCHCCWNVDPVGAGKSRTTVHPLPNGSFSKAPR